MGFKYYRQIDTMDCGPTCLRMVSHYYGKNYSLQSLRNITEINKAGVSILGLSQAAEKIGFRTTGAKVVLSTLKTLKLPCIIYWNQNHFVVLHKINKHLFSVADPSKGLMTYTEKEFISGWSIGKGSAGPVGTVLLLEPTPEFYNTESEVKEKKVTWSWVWKYVSPYKKLIFQLLISLAVSSGLQMIFPFLTQSIVDVGVRNHNLNFIYIILFAQLMLMVGRVSAEYIRSWILLHISSRVSMTILSDFLMKLMMLPMSFFDTKQTGDIIQRMNDQNRIEVFLTGTALSALFSIFNIMVFSVILAGYNWTIFGIFIIGSLCYVGWMLFFLKKRRNLDFKRFELASKSQSNMVQLVTGMQEIKLQNCEQQKRWEWQKIQVGLFNYNVNTLALGQYQHTGSLFFNEVKNILITFVAASAVINGQLSLGAMLAVQYIIGQLNSPLEQILTFIQGFQDAHISIERLDEIHSLQDEEPQFQKLASTIPVAGDIQIKNLKFKYPGAGNPWILKDLSLYIPKNKVTAIVGLSGSGKTTLLKLLLRFYEIENGEINVGDMNLNQISYKVWRRSCGVVMQDGFIFSDSIINNIAVGDEDPDIDLVRHAMRVANIEAFIKSLPLGLNTKIGAEGNGISQGQRQRILIARAVYKNPKYLFFDEATNALDSNNESIILKNLQNFFKDRTVIVVAHRLSTVKNADNIIVLHNGEISEMGDHHQLIENQGEYFNLVKNQLELQA